MSDPGPLEHAHGAHPPAEEDVVPSGKIITVGVVALVVFTLGAIAAGMGMVAVRQQVNPEGAPAAPTEVGKAKIGMVEQRLFEHSNQGPAWREQARLRLEGYGWVDREKGLVHVPIGEAMDRVVKGERP